MLPPQGARRLRLSLGLLRAQPVAFAAGAVLAYVRAGFVSLSWRSLCTHIRPTVVLWLCGRGGARRAGCPSRTHRRRRRGGGARRRRIGSSRARARAQQTWRDDRALRLVWAV